MENDFIVNDNFLAEQDFETIKTEVTATEFQWTLTNQA